jgi:hypothetical protein
MAQQNRQFENSEQLYKSTTAKNTQVQTAVEWLIYQLNTRQKPLDNSQIDELFEQAKEIEQQQIKDAVMYGLDEDGHTGDWKIKFVNDYYDKTFKS